MNRLGVLKYFWTNVFNWNCFNWSCIRFCVTKGLFTLNIGSVFSFNDCLDAWKDIIDLYLHPSHQTSVVMLTLALENGFHTHSKAPRRTLTLGLEGLNICYECCALNEVAFFKSSSVGLMNLSVLVKVIGLKNPPVSPEAVNINFTQANMKTVQMIQELQLH